ncbi:MAG: hypothetical protein JNL72_15105 [Flavipsychrobacter sp.]|nr:hypothetical protein [Flavipsychrobacter sp.]
MMSNNNYNNTGEQNSSAPQLNSLVVDSCYSSATGIMQYQIMDYATGVPLYTSKPIFGATNNAGEFLVVVLALKYCKKTGRDAIVYTDSTTAMAWVRKRKTKSGATTNMKILTQIIEAEQWLRANPDHNKVEKWLTHLWGEIPADFDRK